MKPPTLVRKQRRPAALTPSDQKLLAELEAKVENSMMGFCVALAEIRDHKDGIFWKERYTSFQEYCEEMAWRAFHPHEFQAGLPDLMLEIHRVGKRHDLARGLAKVRGFGNVRIQEGGL